MRYFSKFHCDGKNKYVVNIVSCVWNTIQYVVLTTHNFKFGLLVTKHIRYTVKIASTFSIVFGFLSENFFQLNSEKVNCQTLKY